jgi:hypothetical protein
MTFPIASIAKFLMQLAILTPAVNDSIDRVRHLIDTIRKPAGTRGGTGQAIRERNHRRGITGEESQGQTF